MQIKLLSIILIFSLSLFARTKYAGFSPFLKSGEVVFQHSKDLKLRNEQIDITFFGNKTSVSTSYDLEQKSDSLIHIQCALPVHLINETSDLYNRVNAAQTLKEFLFGNYQYNGNGYSGLFSRFTLTLNDSTIPIKANWHESEDILFIEALLPLTSGRNSLFLSYEVENHYYDTQFATSMIPGFSERTFVYDFSSAACWDEITVDSLTMSVYVRDDAALFFNENYTLPRMLKKRNDFLGAPYRVMNFSMEKVMLSNLAPITLKADISPALKTEHLQAKKLKIPQDAISIKTSKTVKEHTLVNLTDNDLSTGLKLSGGRGNWIEIAIDTSKIKETITGIYLLNGNWRSENHYKASRRIKTANIEVSGSASGSPTTSQRHKMNYISTDSLETDSTFYGNKVVELFSQKGSSIDKVQRCKITIQDLFAGKKYSDLILSEIILTGK